VVDMGASLSRKFWVFDIFIYVVLPFLARYGQAAPPMYIVFI